MLALRRTTFRKLPTNQYLKGSYKKDGKEFFTRACSAWTRGSSFKLKFRLDIRNKFFTVKVVRLPRKVVDASSLFKDRLAWGFEQPGLAEGSLPTVVRLELNDL